MTTFYLLRHGKRVNRTEETQLSAEGIKQAERVATYLEKQKVNRLIFSPLKRTQQTAQIINVKLGIPFTADHRLLERMVFDHTKGKTFEEFLEEWDRTMGDRDYQPEYGDSARFAGDRMKAALDELPSQESHLIISHGGIIGDLLRNIFPDELLPFCTDPASSLKWVEISECSLTELERKDGQYFLKRVNDVKHLI